MREALGRCLAAPDDRAVGELTAEVVAVASLPVLADGAAPGTVVLGLPSERGPWVGYLPRGDGAAGWLALGWRPAGEAPAMRTVLPLDVHERFQSGPLGPTAGCRPPELCEAVLVAVFYQAADLPPEHRLLNDLQAMVMLHGLLAESRNPH